MGVLRLDFLISFLSDQIICGFTTGAAFHVALAQMNKVLGVALPRHSGYGKLFMVNSLSQCLQLLFFLDFQRFDQKYS